MNNSPFSLEGRRAGDEGGALSATHSLKRPADGGPARARHLRREQTVAERMLWERLRKLDFKVRRQAPIGNYIADFVIHASSLVIEIDGPRHGEPERQAADAVRTAWLNGKGYRVVRFAEKQVRENLDQIVEAIVAEAAPPSSPTLLPSREKGEPRYQVR